ncbi:hypothetical protein TNCV_1460891 [Trichonephila clavipes]|nr:hypothetical protein TNCV_1460891 [Trichonephila clavipes]
MTAQHDDIPDKDTSASKEAIYFCWRKIASSSLFPDEDSPKIILCVESLLIHAKNTLSFLVCPRIACLIPDKRTLQLSEEGPPLDTGLSLLDVYILFSWKIFFQMQKQCYEKALLSLCVNVIV